MTDLQIIQKQIERNKNEFAKLIIEIRDYFIGKTITINKKSSNGQPYGRSRKPLKGTSFTCTKHTFIYCNDGGRLYIQPPDCNAVIYLDECLITPKGGRHGKV